MRRVTPAQQHQADLAERDRARLERLGVIASAKIGLRVQTAVVRAYQRGDSPFSPIRRELEDLEPIIVDAMVSAHIAGGYRAIRTAAPHTRTKIKLANTVYDNALDFLRRRMRLDFGQLEQMTRMYRASAVKVIDEVDRLVTRRVERAIFESVKKGDGVRQGVKRLRSAFHAAGIEPTSSSTLEGVFRTQAQVAYSAGRWNTLQAPAIQEVLWGFRYATVGDDRVRPNHAAMEGVTLPKDHPFWTTNYPPCGYNCRCAAVELFRAPEREVEPEPITIDGVTILPQADPGYRVNFGEVFSMPLAA